MNRVAFQILSGVLLGLAVVAGAGRASLYQPDDPMAIPVGEGRPQPLPFGEFKRRLSVLLNALLEPKKGEPDNPDRKAFLDRIAAREKKKLSAADTAALAADLLRVGRSDEALNRLEPRVRDRQQNYFVLSTLGTVHAARGSWDDAINYQTASQIDAEMPETVPGLTKPQRDWWAKLDRDVVPHYYKLCRQTAKAHAGLAPAERDRLDKAEEPLGLFPLPDRSQPNKTPVRFVNDAGEYEPGVLAEAERAKLPPDAVPILQQLILWYPGDPRLYWLLAEVYAAEDNLDAALTILDECAASRQFANRDVLMAHRSALREAIEARKPPPPPPVPISMKTVWIYFGAVGLVAVFAFVRAMMRRGKGTDCGPVG